MARREVDFAVNRTTGEESVLPHNGFERPVDCQFGPDGSLYVVDWGEMVPAPERGGVEIRLGTGMLWPYGVPAPAMATSRPSLWSCR